MKLEETFYRMREFRPVPTGFEALVALLPEHPVYAGHFPAQAVVPGVMTLALVRECAARRLGREVTFAAIRECKFVGVLLPAGAEAVELNFTITEDLRLAGTVARGGEVLLKLKATLQWREP